MARRRLKDRRVLITGASSGIGRALAKELGSRGARLLLNARRESLVRSLCAELTAEGIDAQAHCGDLTLAEVQQGIGRMIADRWGALDILVNNAGVGAVGAFADASPDRLARIFDLNFFAPAALIRATLPMLRAGTEPIIVNVGSILGRVAAPFKSEYCASKFALLGFSNALRMELRPSGIDVLVVTPSTVDSDFFSHHLEDTIGDLRRRPWSMSPSYVARRIVRGIETRKRELYLPPISGWLVPLLQACPRLADWLATRWASIRDQPP